MNKIRHSIVAALLVAGALALASCTETSSVGCGQGPGLPCAPTNTNTGQTGATGTRVQLLAGNPQIASAGTTTVPLTAFSLDANGQAVSTGFIIISPGNDPSAFISDISGGGVPDSGGKVTATLNLGGNKTNRTIAVVASNADAATGTVNVAVVGTTVTVSGASSLAFGASTNLTFAVKDSAGTAIPGVAINISSATGNSLSPASGTTDASGQFTSTVTAAVGANDTITANAAGATKTQALNVSGAGFAFTTPASGTDIPLNTLTDLQIHWTNAGNPVVGSAVSFSTTRGNITGSGSLTDGSGNVGNSTSPVRISSTSAGPATITASGPGGTPAATLNVTFVATTATSVSVQAVPGTVQPTTGAGGQIGNTSTISVVVRDAANNLVKNANVSFTLDDTTGGTLSSGTAVTDINGGASVTYTAAQANTSSAQNGVTITARVDSVGGQVIAPISGLTSLTVAGQALLVRLGTDNLVASAPPLNKKTWVAVVTDAAGNAVVGTPVQFALITGRYKKGHFDPPASGATKWTISLSATCANEDGNHNGFLDGSLNEDINHNGSLEPGAVATVVGQANTDSSGIAVAVITYPKDHAFWAEVTLEARAGVNGNDPPSTATFFLDGLASDYTDANVPPPGEFSPYGDSALCSDTL